MTHLMLLKSAFLLIPLWILFCALVRIRWRVRLPVGLAVAIAAALALPAWVDPGILAYLVSFACMASIYSILALGLNLQWGYNAHLNFGIAGLFAVGAFTTALFTKQPPTGLMAQYTKMAFALDLPFLVGVLAGGVAAGIVALLIAIPILRLRMDFLAIATLGIAEAIRRVFQTERWLANGPQPLRGIPQPLKCAFVEPVCGWMPPWLANAVEPLSTSAYNYLYLVIMALALMILYLLAETAVRSPWGRMLRGVRDEEEASAMSGKNVPLVRVQAFVVGGIVMGFAGALYAHFVITIDYTHFKPLFATFLIWVMLMLGGSGNNRGAILGAFVVWGVWGGTSFLVDALEPALTAISPLLADRAAYIRWLLVALLLAGIVMFRPQGILAEETVVSRYLHDRRSQAAARGRIHARGESEGDESEPRTEGANEREGEDGTTE